MEDYGNIIYLLLLIGVSIFGSVSKTIKANREKKRGAKQVEMPTAEEVQVASDDLPEFENWVEPTSEQPKPKPVEPVYLYQEPHHTPVQPSVHQPQSSLHRQSANTTTKSADDDLTPNSTPRFSTPDDARAAFIASEIFNRRY